MEMRTFKAPLSIHVRFRMFIKSRSESLILLSVSSTRNVASEFAKHRRAGSSERDDVKIKLSQSGRVLRAAKSSKEFDSRNLFNRTTDVKLLNSSALVKFSQFIKLPLLKWNFTNAFDEVFPGWNSSSRASSIEIIATVLFELLMKLSAILIKDSFSTAALKTTQKQITNTVVVIAEAEARMISSTCWKTKLISSQ